MTMLLRYGIEQEYTLLQSSVKWPLGWPVGGYPGPQVVILFNVMPVQSTMFVFVVIAWFQYKVVNMHMY